MSNLELWEKVREVPQNAQKPIGAGRLKGKTDINPMWRIKKLTEIYGPCGIGWYYEITDKRIEDGGNNEKVAIVDITLFVKVDGEWSKPIVGTGGNTLVAKESRGLYTNDECFKMALTDAISVSCKALGFGADIYWAGDNTKYNDQKKRNFNNQPGSKSSDTTTKAEWTKNTKFTFGKHEGKTANEVFKENPDYFKYLAENTSDKGLKEYSLKIVEYLKNKVEQGTNELFDSEPVSGA